MSDYPEVVYWLTLINESGLKLNLVKPVIQRWCVVERRALSDLFELSPLEWSTTFGMRNEEAEQAARAGNKLAQQASALARWHSQGFEPLTRIDPRYPKRLIQALSPAQQPLLLWAQGAIDLLNDSAVTMLGGEAPDEAAAQFIEGLLQALIREDIGLVSGYGRGLDRASFEMMLHTAGGRSIAILPMGLSAFAKTTSKLESALESKQTVLVSPFAPDTPYQEKFADARNLLIDYLALALLVLDSDDDAAARAGAALNRGSPVFVSLTDTTSNRALIDQGALLLTDAGEVVEMVQQAVIDAALLESDEMAAAMLPAPLPSDTATLAADTDPNDDYSLRFEAIEPIDSKEALEILSMGGEVPELLRQRLKKAADDDEE